MSIFKCKMCGGELEISADQTVATCEYCGTQQTLPRLDDDRRANLYDRANHFRRSNDFDKAESIYERILSEDNTDAEVYWSLVLCRYGIEYVEDPTTHRRVPTVNRAQFTSIFDDENYKSALQYADTYQRGIYEAEAKAINEIQKGILAISQKEEPFDVFICYKETDNNGRRTPDSVLANDLYHQLTQEGFKVFFSRITLEDKLGSAYEPYIFAALNSARVMVVLGTRPEYFNAVWVKNEWSRYLALIRQGQKKMLIPAYKDMDPYDLPEEFSHLQAQDMGKLGFMQDLIRGIQKIAQADEPKTTIVRETVATEGSVNIAPLLKRAFMFLEDGDWKSADEYCEKVLDMDPENARAYLGKLMAELKVKTQKELKNAEEPFDDNKNYQKAMRFGDESLRAELTGCAKTIQERKENARRSDIYSRACNRIKTADTEASYSKAATLFTSIPGYRDADELARQCREKAEQCRKEEEARREAEAEARREAEAKLEAHRTLVQKQQEHSMDWSISAGKNHTVGLKLDGTVVAVGKNDDGQCNVSDWTDVASVSAGSAHTVGLKAGGTVAAVGSNYHGQCNVSGWADIVSVSVGDYHTVGLKSDGTVVAVGNNDYGQCNVSDWTDIVAVSAGQFHTVGLKPDGTMVAVGSNYYGQCNISGWVDIVAVSAGNQHTVGLKLDGMVVTVGGNGYDQHHVSDWTDIVAVSAGNSHVVGLKSDGTVVAVGSNYHGQCNVSRWTDIVSVSTGGYHTVGLKSDGTVVAAGSNRNEQCNVSGWMDIAVPKTALEERKAHLNTIKEKAGRCKCTERVAELRRERETLQTELANLKGLFSGKRRREIEAQLSAIQKQLESADFSQNS